MATILAVDDEQPILELIKNGLQKDGHMVTGYVSAEQVPLNSLNHSSGASGHYDAWDGWFFLL